MPKPKLELNSGGNYAVLLYGVEIGYVGKVGRIWVATLGEQDLGEHRTRKEAVEAMMYVYET